MNYGKNDPECVKKVKQLYNELQLQQVYIDYEEQSYQDLMITIDKELQQTNLPKQLFVEFADRIYKRKKWFYCVMLTIVLLLYVYKLCCVVVYIYRCYSNVSLIFMRLFFAVINITISSRKPVVNNKVWLTTNSTHHR